MGAHRYISSMPLAWFKVAEAPIVPRTTAPKTESMMPAVTGKAQLTSSSSIPRFELVPVVKIFFICWVMRTLIVW